MAGCTTALQSRSCRVERCRKDSRRSDIQAAAAIVVCQAGGRRGVLLKVGSAYQHRCVQSVVYTSPLGPKFAGTAGLKE